MYLLLNVIRLSWLQNDGLGGPVATVSDSYTEVPGFLQF